MRPKVSRSVIFVRAVTFVWAVLWLFFHVLPFEGYYYVKIWSTWWFSLALAVAIVLRVGVISYIVEMLTYGLICGNDPGYREARQAGWHPFWDNIPSPINPNNSFVPPENWNYCCPICNARVEKPVDICWSCGYGANGDSTAYYERYGYPEDGGPSVPVNN